MVQNNKKTSRSVHYHRFGLFSISG